MKKSFLIIFSAMFLFMTSAVLPQQDFTRETKRQKDERMKWWRDARFGMFIHWGLYAIPAGEWGNGKDHAEWIRTTAQIPIDQYEKFLGQFNPVKFNADEWVKMAKDAGMKYIVITSKHHDGFNLFDSPFTDFDVMSTPFHRDIMKELSEAAHKAGIKICWYHSIMDWHHPDYTIDRNHPQSANTDEEYDKLNAGRDMNKYREYIKNQVRELLTNYGKIDIIWLDYSFPKGKHGKSRNDWDSENLLKMVRDLQPGIIVNDRLDLDDVDGGWDFKSPEQYKPSEWVTVNGKKVPWETCQTFSGSWGYYRDEASWKDNKQLLVLLIETVSKGGNLLLNVGPTARGTFDSRAQDRLKAIGEWMKVNGRSIYGCTQAPAEFKAPENSLLTYNPETKRLYIHLLDWPMDEITLKGYGGKIKYAQFLNDASEILMSDKRQTTWMNEKTENGDVILQLPILKPNAEIPVIELFLK